MATTESQRTVDREATMEAAQRSTADLAIIASAASVALSWYQFFGRGNRMQGIFVGLWPPTILAFASYYSQKRMEEKLSSFGASNIVSSLEQMLSGR